MGNAMHEIEFKTQVAYMRYLRYILYNLLNSDERKARNLIFPSHALVKRTDKIQLKSGGPDGSRVAAELLGIDARHGRGTEWNGMAVMAGSYQTSAKSTYIRYIHCIQLLYFRYVDNRLREDGKSSLKGQDEGIRTR